jgi:hypothetical protein
MPTPKPTPDGDQHIPDPTGASSDAADTDALFNGAAYTDTNQPRTLAEVPLEQLVVMRNPRKSIDAEGITRLAGSMMRRQLIPGLGYRVDEQTVHLYDGQRRKLAAERSHELAGQAGYEGLSAVAGLIVLLFEHEPTNAEIRRAQAQANAHEALTIPDLQQHFAELWDDYAGLEEQTRILRVCEDLGIGAGMGHNLRRQLTLPDAIRSRVTRAPGDGEISIRLANRLADMNTVAPQLTKAVAERVVTRELHNDAMADLGSFVHRTVVEDETVYAVRLREGENLMIAHTEIARARAHLAGEGRGVIASALNCEERELDKTLAELEEHATKRAVMITIDQTVRDRAINGGYAYVHERGGDLDDAVWIIDPAFMLGLAEEAVSQAAEQDAHSEPSYFQTARDETASKARKEAATKAQAETLRQHEAYGRNLALGASLSASLIELKPAQLEAVRQLVCHLLAERFSELIAYGAGWTDSDRQQPVGDTKRFEPRQVDAIVAAELDRALGDRDPLRGITQLVSRLAIGFVLDPLGVSMTKALGRKRMESHLRDALPGGDHPGRKALWELVRPVLSPLLVDMHKASFVTDTPASTADLAAHRASSDLADLDLGDDAIAV